MEHITVSSLTKHLKKNNILNDLQNGFRERQLQQLINDLARNMTESKQTNLILLDFSKELDCQTPETPIQVASAGDARQDTWLE